MSTDEQPKLRKRSEAGKRQAELPALDVTELLAPVVQPLVDGFPRGFAGAGHGTEEDIAGFTSALKECGFAVSLVEAAKWGPAGRNEVRKWLTTKNRANLPPMLAAAKKVPASAQNVLSDPPEEKKPALARLDADRTAEPKTIITAPVQGSTEGTQFAGPATTHVDVESGKRTELHQTSPETRRAFAAAMDPKPEKQVARRNAAPEIHHSHVANGSGPSAAETVAAELASEIVKQEDLPPAPIPDVLVSGEYERFIETIMREVDLDAEYERLLPHLEVGEQRKDYAVVYEALDKAERRAFDANGLWINARMEYERLKLDQKEVDSALYRRALAALEKKGDKTRLADVDAKIAELYPDEWRSGKLRLKKAELATERVESFAKLWNSKVASLRALLDNSRR